MTAPKIGDVVEIDGRKCRVTYVTSIPSPYAKKSQSTGTVGYQVGAIWIDERG